MRFVRAALTATAPPVILVAMRAFTPHSTAALVLALLCAVTSAHAAPHKRRPHTGKPIRTIGNRVTVFYEYKTKDGQYHKTASVSRTVPVKVVRPSRPHTP